MQNSSIIADTEIKELTEDSLEFKVFGKTLRRIILGAKTPITIGIHGKWGAGKTSIMQLTKKLLEEKGATTIWFNAWKYNKEDALWRALILTILVSIEKDIRKKKSEEDKELEQIRERLYRAIETEEKGGIELDVGGIVKGGLKIVLTQVPFISQLKGISDIITKIKTRKPVKNGVEELLDSIQRETKKVYRERIQFMEQFEAEFQELVNKCVGEDGRLVVFIDDLDRCLPEQSIDILEAIKLFLNAERCVFVIGVDKKVVQDGIKLRYTGVDVGGVDYLEKIIQVPFTVPEIRENDIQEFVRKIAPEEIGKHAAIIAKIGGNPRRIKRIINKFILQTTLAEEKPGLKDMIDTDILAKLLVLELRWDVFYGDLTSSKFLTYEDEQLKSLLLKELNELIDLKDHTEAEKRIENPNINIEKETLLEYYKDALLTKFLDDEPTLWDINLEQYVYLAGTVSEEAKINEWTAAKRAAGTEEI
jgi:hypothetical protein